MIGKSSLLTESGVILLTQEILLVLCLSVQLLVGILLSQHILIFPKRREILSLHRLVLRSVHVDVVEIGASAPRQDRVPIHLESCNRVFGLVDRIHHVFVDGSVDEDVGPLVLLSRRISIVWVIWVEVWCVWLLVGAYLVL